MKFWIGVALVGAASAANAQDAKATFQKVCGTCHETTVATATHRSRVQWQEEIDKMISLGAKATDDEFTAVLDYLTAEYGRDSAEAPGGGGRGRGGRAGAPQPRQTGMGAGPDDKHVVDDAAADRGRKVWAAQCIDCHGTYARGTDNGPNLVRSDMMWSDRYGDKLGAFLRKGHPMQSGAAAATLTRAQISELAHFIHQRLYDTFCGSPIFIVHDVVTGDPKAGAAYFNGAGKCNTCHSPTGDLRGVGAKYDPPTLQARLINPRPFGGGRGGRGGRGGPGPNPNVKQVTLTVTPRGGASVTGAPIVFDDFDVSVRDSEGVYHSWRRTPDLKVVKNDPYAAHDELIEKYTDKNMHDLVAYLVTLK
ncbi:MAG TPA: cytochrome c [Bryobacteraceae bacterium]